MGEREYRGSAESPDYSKQGPNWESLNIAGKVEKSIKLMSDPELVSKRGRASGEDALMMRIEKDPELASEITASPEGREAVLTFIKTLYRSEGDGRAAQAAQRALRLFALELTPEEQQDIRDAELDCRAYVIGTDPYPDNSWFEGLSDEEKAIVEQRAEIHRNKINRRENR